NELRNHGIAATKRDAAVAAINAGVDMDMVDGAYLLLASDTPLPMEVIDRAVRRVLRAKFDAGLFDDPFTPETFTTPPEHRQAARRVAQHSMVLLRNEGALLPLSKEKRIALVGPLAASREDMLGPWAAEGKAEETISVRDGLVRAGAKLVDSP